MNHAAAIRGDDNGRKVHIIQGEYRVSGDADVVLTTLLGSCVAACLWDEKAGVGGMNHFLLPGEAGAEGMRYGVHAMELLVNDILKRGGRRDRLQAKLFGGARLSEHLSDVGALNTSFAERFVRDERIPVVGASLRGEQARRVQFWPVGGRARQILLSGADKQVLLAERRPALEPAPAAAGALELF
jgi:chemotaxis protein CheD